MKLHVRSFGLAWGILLGLAVFAITWWIIITKGLSREATIVGQFYIGYNISPLGSFIGLAWGFVEGWLGGMFFAWLYNSFAGRFLAGKS